MKSLLVFLSMPLILLAHFEMAQAAPRTASTGDLGLNVIYLGGTYTDYLNISRPSRTEPAVMTVRFRHWDSPEVPVDVVLNQQFVGSFLAEPFGPEVATFDVAGLLVNGENEIHFQGYHAPDHPDLDPGNYLITQIDIDYFESETSNPIAEAGPDRIVLNEVFLDGSGSSDADGTIIFYQWELVHRVFAAYNRSAGGPNPTATISNLAPGFYDVALTVTDDDPEGLTASDTMVLAVAGGCDTSGLYTQAEVDQLVAEAVAAAAADKDAVIAGLNQTISGLNTTVDHQDQALAELNASLREKDAAIAGLNQTIEQQNATIAAQNQTIAQLNATIAEKDAAIAGLNQTIEQQNETIAAHNQTIAQLNASLAEKDQIISGLNATIDAMYTKEELDQAIADALEEESDKYGKHKDHKKKYVKYKDQKKKHGKSKDFEKKYGKNKDYGKSGDHKKKHG